MYFFHTAPGKIVSCNDTVSCVNNDDYDNDGDDDDVDGCVDCRAGSRLRNLTSFQIGYWQVPFELVQKRRSSGYG